MEEREKRGDCDRWIDTNHFEYMQVKVAGCFLETQTILV